jgi:low affinity Fe/Cu permease
LLLVLGVSSGSAAHANSRVERFKRAKIRPGWFRRSFLRFANATSEWLGSHWAFMVAVALVLVWAAAGPLFGFSDSWSLAINTITTIGTWIMVFVIQNTQNRDSKAIHLKLDELIRAIPEARDEFMEAEEEDLDEILREKAIVDRADPAPPGDGEEHRHRSQHEERKAS